MQERTGHAQRHTRAEGAPARLAHECLSSHVPRNLILKNSDKPSQFLALNYGIRYQVE